MAGGGHAGAILIVLQDFALGGTERIAVRLANAWARDGRAVTIFCGEDDGPLAALLDRGAVPVVTSGVARGRGSTARLGRAAARWLATHPVDAVFVPGNYHWPALRALAAVRPRPPLIAQVSAAVVKPQRRGLRRRAYAWRLRRLLGRADAAVTLSDRARDEVRAIAPLLAVTTIPLPALEDDLPPPGRAEGTIVMAAGRLVPEKGFHALIDAFARLDDPRATLVIVGEGPDRARLEARVEELAIAGRVSLPGYAPDIRPWLERARLFVLSSHYEGYAAVLVEALAAGRPVVATDCTPATDELLHDRRFGRVVPIDDIAAMAAAIGAVLADPAPDPASLAAAVARHGLTQVARDYLALFDRLATARR